MARRSGSGRMARGLKRTQSGRRPKRRTVKLDFSGLKKFMGTFGTGKTNGITFSLGLFDAESARKGLMLEFGTDTQVARPWLSSTISGQSGTQRLILKTIGKFVRDAFAGRDSKNKTKKALLVILQRHLMDQRFQAAKLTDSTIRQKKAKGSSHPTLIGIDTFAMATKLDVRTKGSLHRSIRGK